VSGASACRPLLTDGLISLVQFLLQAHQDAIHTLLKAAGRNQLMRQLQDTQQVHGSSSSRFMSKGFGATDQAKLTSNCPPHCAL
jgi:hypothetical protein